MNNFGRRKHYLKSFFLQNLIAPQNHLNYVCLSHFISAMDLSVAKGLSLGKTIIIGRCIGVNPVNSQQIVYSEDQIEINVVNLNKVKIQTPLRRVRSGSILPASIWGVPNISPLILGNERNLYYKFDTKLMTKNMDDSGRGKSSFHLNCCFESNDTIVDISWNLTHLK